jgi:hypothetical protein
MVAPYGHVKRAQVDDGHLKTWDLRSSRLAFRKAETSHVSDMEPVEAPTAGRWLNFSDLVKKNTWLWNTHHFK